MLSTFFSKVIFLGLAAVFSTSSYAPFNIENTDPSSPLVPAIKAVVSSVRQVLHDEEAAFQAEEEKLPMVCFLDMPNTSGYAPSPKPSAAEYLVHDLTSLANAKKTLAWFSKKAEKVKACLKTKAARTILDAIMHEASIDVEDIEFTLKKWAKKLPKKYPYNAVDYALHERFQESSSKALSLLINHITPGILAGSKDEQTDLKALCSYFLAVHSVLDNCYEDSEFYYILRQHFIECYDMLPKAAVIARATVLQQINDVGVHTLQTDDIDDYAVQSSVLELTRMYSEAIKLWFVDKAKPDIRTYVFNVTPWRLRHFSKYAPELFDFCQTNFSAAIKARFIKDKWKDWSQSNQTIWVDPKGCISIRLKTDGSNEFTVGFLAENPYYLSYTKALCLNTSILGDRRTEMLKFSPYGNLPFIIPAALNGDTPYWKNQSDLSLKIMDSSHGKTR